MTTHDVQSEILDPMEAMFQPPHQHGEAERRLAFSAYVAVLKGFDGPTLHDAWLAVVAEYRGRTWPVPGVIVAAALKANKDRRAVTKDSKREDTQRDREAYWRDVVRVSITAQQAVKLRVARAVKMTVLDDGTRLHQIDLHKLADAHRSAANTAARIQADLPLIWQGRNVGVMKPAMKANALAMYRQMELEEAQIAQEIADAAQTPS